MSRKVLVLGASGYVGSRLVPLLLARGNTVRGGGRRLSALEQRSWARDAGVELVAVDVFDLEGLTIACEGCDAVYYLVHSMNPQHKDFGEADRQAAHNMAAAAERSGVRQIIYMGGLGDESGTLSPHLRSRLEVGKILQSGSVPATVLRAAMVIGAGSASFEILRYLVLRLPIMITPKWVMTESQPIGIRNVIHYLAGCLDLEPAKVRTFDIGGPDILSYRCLMEIFAEEASIRKPIILPVPILSPRLSSHWIGLVTPISSSLGRPLAEGLSSRVVCQEHSIRDLIPQELFSCRQAIRKALDPRQRAGGEAFPLAPEWKHPGDPPWVGGPAQTG